MVSLILTSNTCIVSISYLAWMRNHSAIIIMIQALLRKNSIQIIHALNGIYAMLRKASISVRLSDELVQSGANYSCSKLLLLVSSAWHNIVILCFCLAFRGSRFHRLNIECGDWKVQRMSIFLGWYTALLIALPLAALQVIICYYCILRNMRPGCSWNCYPNITMFYSIFVIIILDK